VLYGYETLSLSLRDKDRLGIFENRLMKRIFGHTRGKEKGGWKTLHNEKLHNLYFSRTNVPVIRSRKMSCVGHAAQMRGIKNAYKISVRKPKLNTWKDICTDGSTIIKSI
jgi:hypothetical protein